MSRLLLLLLSTGMSLYALDVATRRSGLERQMVQSALYYQSGDIAVHQCATDPFLHYELKPGAHLEATRPDGAAYSVNIDAAGARYPAHVIDRSSGTFRILCFGGSTMYGAGVNDEDTLPAALERHLNQERQANEARYEVWNFGTSAYTLAQAAHLARAKLAALDADLVLVQLYNIGRRPYLSRILCNATDLEAEIDGGRVFFLEQFGIPSWINPDVHLWLLAHTSLYRAYVARTTVRIANGVPCEFCDALGQSEARRLVREGAARDVPVLFVAIPANGGMIHASSVYAGLPDAQFIDLYRGGREAQFYEVHPPAVVLDDYAVRLVEALRERGRLSSPGAVKGRQERSHPPPAT